jgi:4-hydroxy-tetrahydrodipicolinate reductase
MMKIALIGYGKMGKMIDLLASGRKHRVIARFDSKNLPSPDLLKQCDIAIEFTNPEAAPENIKLCLEAGIPVVTGSTGWYQHLDAIRSLVNKTQGRLLYASNFSIGVNIFFKLNEWAAKYLNNYDYHCEILEKHHTEKKDSPSGTAITTAEMIIASNKKWKSWTNHATNDENIIPIMSERIPGETGTHIVRFFNDIDELQISHKAFNRKGFAEGALIAAEWLINQPSGVYQMSDVLKF